MISPLVLLSCAVLASNPGEVRVSRQVLVKEGHGFAMLGGTWLGRGDYYDSPGLIGSFSYYPTESHGVELRLGYFASSLGRGAKEVFEATGLLPDAHRPVAAALAGYRGSFGYGKLLIAGALIHFDLQATAHAGAFLTDRAVTPALALGPAVLARFGSVVHLQLDLSVSGALEQRQKPTVALGLLPVLAVGAKW